MTRQLPHLISRWSELGYQLVLHALVFILFIYESDVFNFEVGRLALFVQYVIAAGFVNYVLLPELLYKKKYFKFALAFLGVVSLVILSEELVVEKIFYADSAGKNFPGVFFTLAEILPLITILAGGKFAYDALTQQGELSKLRESVKESELQYLRGQINPHFLFNNLNNIYSYSVEGSPKTPDLLLGLSGMLRYMLYECREEYVPLSKEVDQLNRFIELNKLQIDERGQVTTNYAGNISTWRIAPLILIVFVENAFKHGTSTQSGTVVIDVNFSVSDEGVLTFECKNSFGEDDQNSLTPASNTEGLDHGIGLENVRKRLGLLYPGSAHSLDIAIGGGYHTVSLTMQLDRL